MKILFIAGWLIAAALLAVGSYAATRPQICQGSWNRQHTVLTVNHCHIDW